jgi:organic radical activating enzyme
LVELFSSVQGEGVLIGRRQLFVRLAGCNLTCTYCDTVYTAGSVWRAEREPGSRQQVEFPNPVTSAVLTGLISSWQKNFPLHHALVLTGGEPLLQSCALANWLPDVAPILPVYLETNGTLPAALAEVMPHLTWVSMDIKLAQGAGKTTLWAEHAAFLEIAGTKTCQVKVVVDADTTTEDLVAVSTFVQRHAPQVPLVLQPRTSAGRPAVGGHRLLALQAAAAREHFSTLIIPQTHPLLAVR